MWTQKTFFQLKQATMTSNFDMRMVFENAKSALLKAFPDMAADNSMSVGQKIINECKLTQSDLRFEIPLQANVTSYQFNVLKNEPNLIPGQAGTASTEMRLKQQDSAVIYQLGIFTAAPSGVNDTSFVLDSYPNPVKYGLANADALNSLYNGQLAIKVNNDVLTPNWDILKHYCANQTQQTDVAGPGSPIDQFRGSFDGLYPMEPNVTLIGSKDNIFTLTVPGGISAVLANSRLVCVARCIIAQNSTVVS